jgi:hypothetical protein
MEGPISSAIRQLRYQPLTFMREDPPRLKPPIPFPPPKPVPSHHKITTNSTTTTLTPRSYTASDSPNLDPQGGNNPSPMDAPRPHRSDNSTISSHPSLHSSAWPVTLSSTILPGSRRKWARIERLKEAKKNFIGKFISCKKLCSLDTYLPPAIHLHD